MRPRSGVSRPATQRSVVVLPQPLGPSSVKKPPSGTSKSIALHRLEIAVGGGEGLDEALDTVSMVTLVPSRPSSSRRITKTTGMTDHDERADRRGLRRSVAD